MHWRFGMIAFFGAGFAETALSFPSNKWNVCLKRLSLFHPFAPFWTYKWMNCKSDLQTAKWCRHFQSFVLQFCFRCNSEIIWPSFDMHGNMSWRCTSSWACYKTWCQQFVHSLCPLWFAMFQKQMLFCVLLQDWCEIGQRQRAPGHSNDTNFLMSIFLISF